MPIPNSVSSEAGRVLVNAETCTGCGDCVAVCPGLVLGMTEGRVFMREETPFGCVACGHCMMVCPTESIAVTGRGALPEDALPLPPKEARASREALAALMLSRRSIRFFTEDDVSKEDLKFIMDMAATAPMGIPPWDVGCVALCGRERIRPLVAEIVRGYEGFLRMFRPWVLTLMRPFIGRAAHSQFRDFVHPLAQTYVDNFRAGRDVVLYDAPAVLIFHASPYADAVDASIACTYAMLAAETLGLGTTMIGGAPPILQRNKALCRSLGIPEENKPVMALIVGHPAVHFHRAIRRRLSEARMAQ